MDEINFKYPMIDPVLVKIIKKIYNHKKKETIKSLYYLLVISVSFIFL